MTETQEIPAEIIALARELWWPHHASRTRGVALNELDGGSLGIVTLEFDDILNIVLAVDTAARKECAEKARRLRDVWAIPGGSLPAVGAANAIIETIEATIGGGDV